MKCPRRRELQGVGLVIVFCIMFFLPFILSLASGYLVTGKWAMRIVDAPVWPYVLLGGIEAFITVSILYVRGKRSKNNS